MRPLYLKIRGLNSFIEEQHIDFEKLTSKGIFGIFGPTGSGKSSILDAITLALYGKISRDTTEFINSNCENLYINFKFEISSKVYKFERTMKKDKKERGKYKTSSAKVIDATNGNDTDGEKVIAEGASEVKSAAQSIIGLGSEDFTRSVVLPQGKFSEFLKLKGKDRRDMLERIFGLEKYGKNLMNKIKRAKNENENKLLEVNSKIDYLGDIDDKKFEEVKSRLSEINSREKEIKSKKIEIDNIYEKYKTIWAVQTEYNDTIQKMQKVNEKKKEIDEKKKKLSYIGNAKIVKPFCINIEETNSKLIKNESELKSSSQIYEKLKSEYEKVQKVYLEFFEKKNNEVPELIKLQENVKNAVKLDEEKNKLCEDIKKISSESSIEKNKIEKYKLRLKEFEEKIKDYDDQVSNNEKIVQSLFVDSEYRKKVQNAYEIEKDFLNTGKNVSEIKDRKNKEEKALCEKKGQILKLQESWKDKFKDVSFGSSEMLLKLQEDVNSYKEKSKRVESLISKKAEAEKEIEEHFKNIKNFQKKLDNILKPMQSIEKNEKRFMAAVLSQGLEEGEPCPVCGAVHHVKLAEEVSQSSREDLLKFKKLKEDHRKLELNIQKENILYDSKKGETESISKEIFELTDGGGLLCGDSEKASEKLKYEAEIKEKEFSSTKLFIENITEEKSKLDKECARIEQALDGDIKTLKDQEDKLKGLSKGYKTYKDEINVLSFKDEMENINEKDSKSCKLNEKIKNVRVSLKKCMDEKEKVKNSFIESSKNLVKQEEIIKQKKIACDDDIKEIEKVCEPDRLKNYLKEISDKIDVINKEEEKNRKINDDIKKKCEQAKNAESNFKKENETLSVLLNEQEEKLDNVLKENEIDNLDEIREYFSDIKNESLIRNEIEDYENNITILKSSITELKRKLNGKSIDEEDYKSIIKNKGDAQEEYDSAIKEGSRYLEIKNQMEKGIQNLKIFKEKKKKIEHEKSIIYDIEKLVEGNRFVEFAASNELRYIALEASKRLKKITRDRYALEIDADNNFTMRDDFNGGAVRSVNTLSGGETFLTSLALALALSSKIQLKGSAPLEFFFLDEGFGTLDSNLLDTVMSSLERLQSKRLSIGIISHVDELKNRVPVKLIVEPAKPGICGSRVRIELT